MKIKSIAKKTYHFLRRKKMILSNLKKVDNLIKQPSYYPEKKQKTIQQMRKENFDWVRKNCELNVFYKLYGLDVDGALADHYIDYLSFMESRNAVNRVERIDSQIALLRDKFLFYKYMKSNNLPVPEVFAVIQDGKLYDTKMNNLEWEALKDETDYFIKDIDGECASFVKKIRNYNAIMGMKEKIAKGRFILQRKVTQNTDMNALNSRAINTLRIVTINKNKYPYVLSAILRIGSNKTENVDNWAAGGIAVGIQTNGFLKDYGYYKPSYGTKTNIHPDSGIVLNQFRIPLYKEALDLACKAHSFFYNVRAIGWDIAISENGPIFIEGNDNWEISLMQACDRPLKKEWMEAISN